MRVNQMTLVEHIAELRKRLLIVALSFTVFFIAGFFLAKPIIVYLQKADEVKELTLNAFNLTDPLFIFFAVRVYHRHHFDFADYSLSDLGVCQPGSV